jgi:hypothetical protein
LRRKFALGYLKLVFRAFDTLPFSCEEGKESFHSFGNLKKSKLKVQIVKAALRLERTHKKVID